LLDLVSRQSWAQIYEAVEAELVRCGGALPNGAAMSSTTDFTADATTGTTAAENTGTTATEITGTNGTTTRNNNNNNNNNNTPDVCNENQLMPKERDAAARALIMALCQHRESESQYVDALGNVGTGGRIERYRRLLAVCLGHKDYESMDGNLDLVISNMEEAQQHHPVVLDEAMLGM
jgi:hypothetical protein